MDNKSIEPIQNNTPSGALNNWHENAQKELEKVTKEYEKEIREIAEFLGRHHDIVSRIHVEQARKTIQKKQRRATLLEELAQMMGGVLVGLFIQGMIIELLRESLIPSAVVIYIICLIIGLSLVFWGFVWKYIRQN